MTVKYTCCRCGKKGKREVRYMDQVADEVECGKCAAKAAESIAPRQHIRFRSATVPERLSNALGTHPNKIAETRKFLADRGVDCDFHPDGRAIVKDRQHEKALCRAWSGPKTKMVNFDG